MEGAEPRSSRSLHKPALCSRSSGRRVPTPGRRCSPFPGQEQNKMDRTVPMPRAQDPQILARPGSQAQPLTLTPQQTRAPPAMRCPHASEPGQLPRPSASPQPSELAGMDKCCQQVPAVGLPSAAGTPPRRQPGRQRGGLARGWEVVQQE